MESKNYQKIVIKALGHILFGSIFNASDFRLDVYSVAFVIFAAYSNYLNFTLFGIYCRRIMISVFTSKLILNLTPIFFWLQIGASIQPFLWNFSSKFIQHCQILVHFIFHKIWYKYQGRKSYLFLAFYWHFTSLCNIVLSSQATEWALLHSQAASILKQTNKRTNKHTSREENILFLAILLPFCTTVLSSQATEWALLHSQAAPILNNQTNKQTYIHRRRKTFYFWLVYCHFVPLCLAPKLQSERCFIRKLHPFPASKQSC